MIARMEYLNQLIAWREKKLIKVVTGVRRCGKSTLFALFADYLKSTGVAEEQIISINLEDIAYEDLQNYKALYHYVKARLCKDKYSYVFLDEIQTCKSFEKAVDSYLRALTDSYIFYKVDRYDIKGRQHLKTLGKYYLVDTGIRNLLLTSTTADLGPLIENVVYLELLRRGNKVSIGKLSEKEVDFVASNTEGITYYQVSATVLEETTLTRELEPLQKIPDHHPKVLLTLDEIGAGTNYDGIKQVNLLDWLLE